MKIQSIALGILAFTFLIAPAMAQDAAAPEDPVDRLLSVVRDDTKGVAVRGQAIQSLLVGGEKRAHDALRRILVSEEAERKLRRLVASGVLIAPGFPLLDSVLDVAASSDPLAADVKTLIRQTASAALVEAFGDRIADENATAARRLHLIDLLGHVERRDAMSRLLDLWASDDEALSVAAKTAFLRLLPRPSRFPSHKAAREFLAASPGIDVSGLRALLLGEAGSGEKKADPIVPPLVALLKKMAETATLQELLDDYLRFAAMPEIRRIGAQALARYDYDAKDGEGAAAARQRAASVLLEVLDGEKEDAVIEALLGTAQTLTKALIGGNPERTVHIVARHLESENRDIRMRAVQTLGRLGDRNAIPSLKAQFKSDDEGYRLAILNSLEIIRNAEGLSNGGMSAWFLEKLQGEEKVDAVIVRLIEILGGYEKLDGAVEALSSLLRTSKNPEVRRAAAGGLGQLGARHGDADALTALADVGLIDEDISVREVSALQIGTAPVGTVAEAVLESLLERLGEAETEKRVRTAAASSLLRLEGASALTTLRPFLGDNGIWQEVVLPWFGGKVLTVEDPEDGPEQALVAARVVATLAEARSWARCAEAGRRVLDAGGLVWDGPAMGRDVDVAFDLARALSELGKPKEALAAIPADRLPPEVTDSEAFERRLLYARLLRQAGRPAEGVPVLDALVKVAPPPEGLAVERARLELGRTHLALSNWGAAKAAVTPVLQNAELGAKAREIEGEATAGAEVSVLITGLDDADAAKRKTAVDGLRALGAAAYPALDRWLTARESDPAGPAVAAAVATIAAITGKSLSYDPAAPEADRAKSLAAAHAALRP